MAVNPFNSNSSVFPFTDDDLLLFDPSNTGTGAWADQNFGQGRSVSSLVTDAMNLDSPMLGGTFSPTLTTAALQANNISPPPHVPSSISNGVETMLPSQQQQATIPPPALRRSKTGTKRSSVVIEPPSAKKANRNSIQRLPSRQDSTNSITQDDDDNDFGEAQRTSSSPPANKRQRRDTDAELQQESEDSSGGHRRTSSAGDKGGGNADRLRLTEQEKKSNHIASEQKRRMAIRWGFDKLTEIVPGLEGQGRSESIVLKKSVDYMRKVLEDRQNLLQRVQELGGEVPKELIPR